MIANARRILGRTPPKRKPDIRRDAFVWGGGLGVGLAVMYFLDPRDGRRRRAVARDRSAAVARGVGRRAERRGRYLAGKRHGVTHAVLGTRTTDTPNDVTLQHKIESEVLRDYAKGRINVNVEDGVAVLRGQLGQPDEIRRLIDDVRDVPGVADVRSLLHLPGTPPPTYERAGRRRNPF